MQDSFDLLLSHGAQMDEGVGQPYEGCLRQMFEQEAVSATFGSTTTTDPHQIYKDLRKFLRTDPYFFYIDCTRIMTDTEDGRIGWVPGRTQTGDRVCLFAGATTPFVIRSRDDGF